MLMLAYCAGLRLSEIARLDLGDVDLQSGTITIRETKFFKSRILPLTDSALAALRDYLDARRRADAPRNPDSGLLWHDHGGTHYASHSITCLKEYFGVPVSSPRGSRLVPAFTTCVIQWS
jgi:integrase/recombinase XerD